MATTMIRSSKGVCYCRELSAGVRQYRQTLNSSLSPCSEYITVKMYWGITENESQRMNPNK